VPKRFIFPDPISFSSAEMDALKFPRRYAPFTRQQLRRLEGFQKAGVVHPYRCCGRLMLVSEGGLLCPCCDRKQEWAYSYSTDGASPDGD
jgi:hypothetical protein